MSSTSTSLPAPAAAPDPAARRTLRSAFRRNGIPWSGEVSAEPLPKRLLTNPLFYLFVVALVVDAAAITLLYFDVIPSRQVPGGRLLGIGNEALLKVIPYGLYTVIPLTLVFLWLDRFSPHRVWVWLMAFLWGACVATYLSANINSWAASHLAIQGDGDPATGTRAAIYVAPFVEEATKATVLFWLAILMRYRWVSRHGAVVLAGLSAAGFAFVENLIYYGRIYVAAANTYGASRPEDLVVQLFHLRGIMTCFGHPLFTTMTGIGLAVALRSKSKVVRVVAPLAGYLAAALLHMAFNASASLLPEGPQRVFMYVLALGFVATLIVFVLRGMFAQGKVIRARLTDYTRMGWLPDTDPEAFSLLRRRLLSLVQALPDGVRAFWSTVKIERAVTELACLRDAMVRGLVDHGGRARERELLDEIAARRPTAVTGATLATTVARYRQIRVRRPAAVPAYPAPSYPGPAGIGGSWPAPSGPSWAPPPPQAPVPGSVPVGTGAQQYSAVDPSWGPPRS